MLLTLIQFAQFNNLTVRLLFPPCDSVNRFQIKLFLKISLALKRAFFEATHFIIPQYNC